MTVKRNWRLQLEKRWNMFLPFVVPQNACPLAKQKLNSPPSFPESLLLFFRRIGWTWWWLSVTPVRGRKIMFSGGLGNNNSGGKHWFEAESCFENLGCSLQHMGLQPYNKEFYHTVNQIGSCVKFVSYIKLGVSLKNAMRPSGCGRLFQTSLRVAQWQICCFINEKSYLSALVGVISNAASDPMPPRIGALIKTEKGIWQLQKD